MQAAQRLAVHLNIGQTMHIAETPFSVGNAAERFGASEMAFLERIGFLDCDTLAVHCVHLTDHDIKILKSHNVGVSHNPTSNMYLGSGVAPIPHMLKVGVTVGLATDGPASNNNQNMVEALKFAALLHKVHTLDPTAITAEPVLEMATIGAARSLGIDQDVGSLEVGKKADVVIADLRRVHAAPVHNPTSALVYAATGAEVETVIVDGRILMERGQILTINEASAIETAQSAANELLIRAKIGYPRNAQFERFAH
jgi:5-methylthioadenosine/S-adenosylhomocysteine deaminase